MQALLKNRKLVFIHGLYVNTLRKVAEQYGVSIHQFSDDTAIYLEFCFPPECPDLFDALRILSSCAGEQLGKAESS